MSQIKTLTYSRTINFSNHESERLEATVELEQVYDNLAGALVGRTEDPQEAFKLLKDWVITQLYGLLPPDNKTGNPKTIMPPDPDNYGKFIEQPFPNVSPPE